MFDRLDKHLYWDMALSVVDGCTPVDRSCDNCWAARATHRRSFIPALASRYSNLTTDEGKFNGKIRGGYFGPALRRRIPTAFAVWNDLFHPDIGPCYQEELLLILYQKKGRHFYFILTKRPEIMYQFFKYRLYFPHPNNFILVTSACDSLSLNIRYPWMMELAQAPQPSKRFALGLSLEPLLGPIYLKELPLVKQVIDWVVLGYETGPGARPGHPDWAHRIIRDCEDLEIPVFFKSWGAWSRSGKLGSRQVMVCETDGDYGIYGDHAWMSRHRRCLGTHFLLYSHPRDSEEQHLVNGQLRQELPANALYWKEKSKR